MTETRTQGAGEVATAEPEVAEREFTVESKSQAQLVMRRFVRHRMAMASLAVLVGVVLLATVGLWLWKYNPSRSGTLVDGGQPTLDVIPPLPLFGDGDGVTFGDHPFGQDSLGRDYFAVTLRGAQQTLIIAVTAGLVATFLGTVIGAISGYFRGWVDNALMRVVDVLLTIPLLLIAAVLGRTSDRIPVLNWFFSDDSILLFGNDVDEVPWGSYVSSDSVLLVALVIAMVVWLNTARVIRAEFMSLREKEYVEAARALGTSNTRIIRKHILPNAIGPLVVSATLLISVSILIEAALSFLGFGVQGSDWSLGKLVSSNQAAFTTRPWLFWWPGLFIVTVALCINFIGDGLRDAFDPRQTRVRE